MQVRNDPRLLMLDERDNVLVARTRICAGDLIEVEGLGISVLVDLPIGHKVARRAIAAGEAIIKYGAPIGTASADIRAGEHAHVHNVKSDYTPTYHLEDVRAKYQGGV